MKRLLVYLCLSLFIIVLNISNSSCYNETSSLNKSDSDASYTTPLMDIAENNAKSAKSELELNRTLASTEDTKSVEITTTPPNLEIQSSSTSAVRPTEATTPVPTTESYSGTERFGYSNSDSTEKSHSLKETPDIGVTEAQPISLNENLGDPKIKETLKNTETQHEDVLQLQPKVTTIEEPIRIGKVEKSNVNTTFLPAMKIPIPIVIDYEGQTPDNNSSVYSKKDLRLLQDKEKPLTNMKNDSKNQSSFATSNKELLPNENETSVSTLKTEPEEIRKSIPRNPQLPPNVPTVPTSESSIVIPTSTITKDKVAPPTQKLEPVRFPVTEANSDTTFTSTHSTISVSPAGTAGTATIEVLHDANSEPTVNSSIRISSETETNNKVNISMASTTPQNTVIPVSIVNHTLSTSIPAPTLGTSTPSPRNETFGNGNNPIQEFISNFRTHIISCVISIFLIFLTVSVVCSFVVAFCLLVKFLWKTLVSGCGTVKNCYVKRKDSSRSTYEAGSLFPRCDVAVRPYLASDHDMY